MIPLKLTPSISFALLSIAFLTAAGAAAQSQPQPESQSGASSAPARNSARNAAPQSETDIGVSFYEAMNSSSTGNGVTQTPENSPGGMLEIRHIHSPLIGYELTYGFNPANQTIGPEAAACPSGISCNIPAQKIDSNASLVGLDWIVSKRYGNLRPFLAGGLGFDINQPGITAYANNDIVRPAYLYGGGVDFVFAAHWGVRAQFRGIVYKAPNLSTLFPANGAFTQTSEPMGGIFYSF